MSTCVPTLEGVHVASAPCLHFTPFMRTCPDTEPPFRCVATLEGVHVASVLKVLASPKHIFSASADGTVAVWDLAAAKAGEPSLVAHLVEHSDKVGAIALAFGALFTASADRTVKRWDQTDWTCTLSWRAHDAAVSCLASAPAVELLCTGSEDGRCVLAYPLACLLPTCLLAYPLACPRACLLTYLLAHLLAYPPTCLLACVPTYPLAYPLACPLAHLLAGSEDGQSQGLHRTHQSPASHVTWAPCHLHAHQPWPPCDLGPMRPGPHATCMITKLPV